MGIPGIGWLASCKWNVILQFPWYTEVQPGVHRNLIKILSRIHLNSICTSLALFNAIQSDCRAAGTLQLNAVLALSAKLRRACCLPAGIIESTAPSLACHRSDGAANKPTLALQSVQTTDGCLPRRAGWKVPGRYIAGPLPGETVIVYSLKLTSFSSYCTATFVCSLLLDKIGSVNSTNVDQ